MNYKVVYEGIREVSRAWFPTSVGIARPNDSAVESLDETNVPEGQLCNSYNP